jgi:hypothetical protein
MKYKRHPDDEAVDRFAKFMRRKLLSSRLKGRGGWQGCPEQDLLHMLHEHIKKGDMRDVACIAMFIYLNRIDRKKEA